MKFTPPPFHFNRGSYSLVLVLRKEIDLSVIKKILSLFTWKHVPLCLSPYRFPTWGQGPCGCPLQISIHIYILYLDTIDTTQFRQNASCHNSPFCSFFFQFILLRPNKTSSTSNYSGSINIIWVLIHLFDEQLVCIYIYFFYLLYFFSEIDLLNALTFIYYMIRFYWKNSMRDISLSKKNIKKKFI